jgi:hypothetical protein
LSWSYMVCRDAEAYEQCHHHHEMKHIYEVMIFQYGIGQKLSCKRRMRVFLRESTLCEKYGLTLT